MWIRLSIAPTQLFRNAKGQACSCSLLCHLFLDLLGFVSLAKLHSLGGMLLCCSSSTIPWQCGHLPLTLQFGCRQKGWRQLYQWGGGCHSIAHVIYYGIVGGAARGTGQGRLWTDTPCCRDAMLPGGSWAWCSLIRKVNSPLPLPPPPPAPPTTTPSHCFHPPAPLPHWRGGLVLAGGVGLS